MVAVRSSSQTVAGTQGWYWIYVGFGCLRLGWVSCHGFCLAVVVNLQVLGRGPEWRRRNRISRGSRRVGLFFVGGRLADWFGGDGVGAAQASKVWKRRRGCFEGFGGLARSFFGGLGDVARGSQRIGSLWVGGRRDDWFRGVGGWASRVGVSLWERRCRGWFEVFLAFPRSFFFGSLGHVRSSTIYRNARITGFVQTYETGDFGIRSTNLGFRFIVSVGFRFDSTIFGRLIRALCIGG
mmetsp:Transcript_58116/g.69941  ORF Transcript_58116/g.69941 Transcript_58116/m.69941 type:complete len:238 (-) Transcript_58116:2859-3572(-)